MLPSLPEKWAYGEKVPFQENEQVEFKEVAVFSGLFRNKTRRDSGLPKYRETLVGFLNSTGQGYLIMGVKDDGTIVGVEDMTPDAIDKFRLWVDSNFNSLVYKNGRSIDPSMISIKFYTYPVIGYNSNVVVIEVLNKGNRDIMLRSGTIIYRLNASNFKVSTEPVYRKRDVNGMIQAVQMKMQSVLDEKRKKIDDLHDQIRDLKREVKYIYERDSFCDKVMKFLAFSY